MEKIFFYITVLAAAVACNTAEIDNDSSQSWTDPVTGKKMVTEIVSGQRGSTTKATISNDDTPAFAWTIGDNLAVHVSNDDSHMYVFTSGEGGASVAAASAEFVVNYEAGYSRDAFAVYPSTIVNENATKYGQSGQALEVTLPSNYTLAQVSGTTTPCPMIATNTTGAGWTFYQLCGLLRLTVNAIPPSTNHLKIDFDGKKVWGDFSIASPVTPNSSVIASIDDNEHDVITITPNGTETTLNNNAWLDGQVLNIPLPTGTYTNITVTAFNASGEAILTRTRPFAYEASRLYGTKKTVSFLVFSINGNSFATQTRRVVFAPGNLQATTTNKGDNWTWSFAAHQYDFIGSNAVANNKIDGNGTVSENGTVDLFGRSTSSNSYGISNSTAKADYNGAFQDWGKIKTFSYRGTTTTYHEDYWFTLLGHNDNDNENNQWYRIMNYRQTGATVNNVANARYAMAKINTDTTPVNGIILFPDYYDGGTPDGVSWGTINDHNYQSDWGGTTCTAAGWVALEAAGCVFLPAAGKRYSFSGSIYDYNFYAVNHLSGDYGWEIFHFKSSTDKWNIYWNTTYNAWLGAAVRLVHEVK